jgi:hypothetical protein
MASFFSGLLSVGKKLGRGVENWAEGTKVGQDIDKARDSKNPWAGKLGASGGRNTRPTTSQLAPPTKSSSIGDPNAPIGKQDS